MKKENISKRLKYLLAATAIVIVMCSIAAFANAGKIVSQMNNIKITRNPDNPDIPQNASLNSESIEIMYGDFSSKELYYIPELDGNEYYSIGAKYIYKDSSQDILWPGDVIWTSSDDKVAEVKENGTIIPKSEGTVIISAEYNGFHDSIDVKVKKAKIKKLEIVESGLYQRSVLVETPDGRKYDITDNKDTHWTTSDESLATVDSGYIRLKNKKVGKVSLTATFKEITATTDIYIEDNIIDPKKIKLSENQVLIEDITGCVQILAEAELPNGSVKNITDIAVWESGNPDIVTVYEGRICAVREGETTIDVSYKEFHRVIKVKVKQQDQKETVLHPIP